MREVSARTPAPSLPLGADRRRHPSHGELRRMIAPYEGGETARAWRELALSVLPYVALWIVMYRSLTISYWLTLVLAVPTAGFLIRSFTVQHDCGHGSFFRLPRLNAAIGRALAVLTLTPFRYWSRFHAVHHATSGRLDRRGHFDVDTLTVREYLGLSRARRLIYRMERNGFVLFGLLPFVYFVVYLRLPWIALRAWHRERWSILLTTGAIAIFAAVIISVIGVRKFLQVQLPVTWLAATTGMWLFYVQHQFEHTFWARDKNWDYVRAALEGSSYLCLPPLLEWFTGYIGLHHVHHLSTRVPSYRLKRCLEENPPLSVVPKIGIRDGLGAVRLKLWDEESGRLVGWPPVR